MLITKAVAASTASKDGGFMRWKKITPLSRLQDSNPDSKDQLEGRLKFRVLSPLGRVLLWKAVFFFFTLNWNLMF